MQALLRLFLPSSVLAASFLAGGCQLLRTRGTAEPPPWTEAVPAPAADAAAAPPAEGLAAAATNADPAVATTNAPPADAAPASQDPLYLAADRYMKQLNIDAILGDLAGNVVAAYRVNVPRVPPVFWDEFLAAVDRTWINDRFREEVMKIYSLEELNLICDFFDTPAGKAFLKNEKLLQRVNSQHAGAFSRRINAELERVLRARRFIP